MSTRGRGTDLMIAAVVVVTGLCFTVYHHTDHENIRAQMTPTEREISRKALDDSVKACVPAADEPDKSGWAKAHQEDCQNAMKAMRENSPLAFAKKRDLRKRCDAVRDKKIVDLTINDFEILKECGISVQGLPSAVQ